MDSYAIRTTRNRNAILTALAFVLALGGAMFPFEYASSSHETSRRCLALTLAILIPMPWLAIVRNNRRIEKILDAMGQASEELEEVVRISTEASLSVLLAVYSIIIVLCGNLFFLWK